MTAVPFFILYHSVSCYLYHCSTSNLYTTTVTTTNDSESFKLQVCNSCNQQFHRRGITAHQVACFKKEEQRRRDAIFEAKMKDLEPLRESKYFIEHRDLYIFIIILILKLFDQETPPPKPRMAKPWENPALREKRKRSSNKGVPFLSNY
jgi:hypothetical protein